MALTLSSHVLSDTVMTAVRTGVTSFRSANKDLQQLLLRVAQGTEGVRLPVFTPGVPDVLRGGSGLHGHKSAGWRLAAATGGAAIAADIHTLARGGPRPLQEGTPRVACVRQGPHIARMLQAIAALAQPARAAQFSATPYVPYLLIMPDLYTEALWLLPQKLHLAPPVVFPYYTLIKRLRVLTPHSESEFIARLRPTAEKWMSFPKPRFTGHESDAAYDASSGR